MSNENEAFEKWVSYNANTSRGKMPKDLNPDDSIKVQYRINKTINEGLAKDFSWQWGRDYFSCVDDILAYQVTSKSTKSDSAQEIAELDAKWMQARADRDHAIKRWDTLSKEIIALQAHINELREALEVIAAESHHELWQAGVATKALASTPAQSLTKIQNEAIDKSAEEIDAVFMTKNNLLSRKIRALKKEVD